MVYQLNLNWSPVCKEGSARFIHVLFLYVSNNEDPILFIFLDQICQFTFWTLLHKSESHFYWENQTNSFLIEKKTYLKECSDECFKGTVVNKTCSLWIDAHLRPFNKRPPKILLLAQVENNEGGKSTDARKRKQNIRQNTEKKKIYIFY